MRNTRSYAFPHRRVSAFGRVLLTSLLIAAFAHVTAADVQEAADRRGDRAEIWKTVLDRMPETWRGAHRVVVNWVSDREMARLVADQEEEDNQRGDDSTIQGFYDRAKDDRAPATITIRANLSREEATFVLSHEFAHMVWDEVLTRRDRSDYRRLWDDQRRGRRLVSRYAAESPEEGFAEAVASYLWQTEKLKRRDDLSYGFVADRVREAEEKEAEKASQGRS